MYKLYIKRAALKYYKLMAFALNMEERKRRASHSLFLYGGDTLNLIELIVSMYWMNYGLFSSLYRFFMALNTFIQAALRPALEKNFLMLGLLT